MDNFTFSRLQRYARPKMLRPPALLSEALRTGRCERA